jgi:cytoskeletal protein CcmA (bactofilin family)
MYNIQNEKGSALLTVFFIIILFMVLGFSIASFTLQGAKQRAFADDEVQGKMLADMGLNYFKTYIEKNATIDSNKTDNDNMDTVTAKIKEIANECSDVEHLSYKPTWLPQKNTQGDQGGFAIAYVDKKTIPYKNESSPVSQPYVRELTLYIVGIPPRAAVGGIIQKRVRLETTVYINTISSPFHYAVSTAKDLQLMGGPNIIGNISAANVLVSSQYQYREESKDSDGKTKYTWKSVDSPVTDSIPLYQSYVEGTIFLTGNPGKIYKANSLSTYTKDSDGKFIIPSATTFDSSVPSFTTREQVQAEHIFTPKDLSQAEDETPLNANNKKPYQPGYEVPVIEQKNNSPSLFSTPKESVSSYIEDQIKKNNVTEASAAFITGPLENESSGIAPVTTKQPFSLEPMDGLREMQDAELDGLSSGNKLVVMSKYSKQADSSSVVPLTLRLTGNKLTSDSSRNINQIFVFPASSVSDGTVTVEMGKRSSFENSLPSGTEDNAFTFNGAIYIKGNLDIVGDININGTIYVDGDVVIREGSNTNQLNNVAIISSGTITLAGRNEGIDPDNWSTIKPLSAFLYSEKQIEIYSHTSFNWINGGIASGSSIELNARREDSTKDYASRLLIQFNRGIFEREIPGLPAGSNFYVDVYDTKYSPLPEEISIK